MERALLPSLGRRGVFTPLANLRDEFDRLFDDWLKGLEIAPMRMLEGDTPIAYVPRVDVVERATELEVTAELPGIEGKDVVLELMPNALVIRGEKVLEKEVEAEGFQRRERRYGAFLREIPLPWDVAVAEVTPEATFRNGVLVVKVPKPAIAPPAAKKIAIQV